jgi:beta-lactamase superfamily II metal-dependent hydrolase
VTIPESSIESPPLELHVLGAGIGESIVLKLPDGRWGVVDCYNASPTDRDANATTLFLRGRGVTKLFFVCLTHPHDDHFLGMVELIKEFQPEEFWRFGCLSHEYIRNLILYNQLIAARSADDALSRSAAELLKLFAVARDGAKEGKMTVCRLNSRTNPYPNRTDKDSTFQIECLSPTGRQIELYEAAIIDCVGRDGKIAKKLPRSIHNEISVVLKITYGETKIILGGDLEKQGWRDVVVEVGGSNLQASAIKVSHHGSDNGYCDGLWERFSASGSPIAVVAPRLRNGLPTSKALTHICRHAKKIYSTFPPKDKWNPPQSITEIKDASLDSRLAIRECFKARPDWIGGDCGRCGIIFDESKLIEVQLDNPAQKIF